MAGPVLLLGRMMMDEAARSEIFDGCVDALELAGDELGFMRSAVEERRLTPLERRELSHRLRNFACQLERLILLVEDEPAPARAVES